MAVLVHTLTLGSTDFNALETFDPGLASGKWAIRFLLLSLSMTPLRTYFQWSQAVRYRKPAGLWSFGFAVVHVLVYFQDAPFTWAAVTRQAFLTFGLVGMAILIALAGTSNRWSMRRLGKHWKRLHRLVYLAGGAVVLHALLAVTASKKMFIRDPQAVHELRIYTLLLVVLLVVRIPRVRRSLLRTPVKSPRRAIAFPVKKIMGTDLIQGRGSDMARPAGRRLRVENPSRATEPGAEPEPFEQVPE